MSITTRAFDEPVGSAPTRPGLWVACRWRELRRRRSAAVSLRLVHRASHLRRRGMPRPATRPRAATTALRGQRIRTSPTCCRPRPARQRRRRRGRDHRPAIPLRRPARASARAATSSVRQRRLGVAAKPPRLSSRRSSGCMISWPMLPVLMTRPARSHAACASSRASAVHAHSDTSSTLAGVSLPTAISALICASQRRSASLRQPHSRIGTLGHAG